MNDMPVGSADVHVFQRCVQRERRDGTSRLRQLRDLQFGSRGIISVDSPDEQTSRFRGEHKNTALIVGPIGQADNRAIRHRNGRAGMNVRPFPPFALLGELRRGADLQQQDVAVCRTDGQARAVAPPRGHGRHLRRGQLSRHVQGHRSARGQVEKLNRAGGEDLGNLTMFIHRHLRGAFILKQGRHTEALA